jgi:hypothetical protein
MSISAIVYAQDSTTSEKTTDTPAEVEADASVKADTDAPEKTDTDTSVRVGVDSIAKEDSSETALSEAEGKTGILKIVTVPESAFVLIDDVLKGKSPITIQDVPVGKRTIVLKKKGHFLKKATVNITAGSDSEIKFELVKPVTLSISSEPANADVMVNMKKEGTTPYKNSKMKPGQYTIELVQNGFESEKRTINLASGEEDSVHVVLTPVKKISQDTVIIEPEDTVTATKEKKSKKEKSKLSSILDKFALGIFVTFSLIILVIELAQDN